ncbi:gene transfer agent family protein [Parasedimentitalea maritima]|uniref:Gene transfer agent family protein n=1 Tax=Parasedimentitalea maritima TaxID=2578117 RepID=A0A6A4RJS9_9RHOB|nr:gene transfer agent family protein [Zongyanglinia marina]KAE9631634.1 gene transfer agent family protein [Zongyanglinia marina]
MSNPWAGEVTLVIDGTPRVMKLTLGALAELEHSLAVGSLVDLVQRFESGGFSTGDVLALTGAGLQGGGQEMALSDLAKAEIEGGVLIAARAAAQLLARAFMMPEET